MNTQAPRERVRTIDLARAALKMERTPGEWMRIPTMTQDANRVVTRQRRGDIPSLPPEKFESRVRERVAYGRYVGNKK